MNTSQRSGSGVSLEQSPVQFLLADRIIPRGKLSSAAPSNAFTIESCRLSPPVADAHLPRPSSFRLKRVIDIIFSMIGLLVVAPLLALISVLIKLSSNGPVLYCAPRAGKKGRSFICYKFRTMIHDADCIKPALRSQNEREGPFFKIAGDPRVTPFGKILRRYSLDEIPQLWNVVRGEMSLVGPRPHPLDDVQLYVPQDLRRLDIAPGITGLWQVTARKNPSFQLSMRLDLEYIERWSLSMDLRILYRTIFAVLQGTGS